MTEKSWPLWLPLRSDLQELTPYGAPQLPVQVRMNTNENPYSPSEELVSAIADRIHEVARSLNRYPDRDAIDVRTKLAKYLSVESSISLSYDQIWAANGSNEIIQSIFLAFGENGALGFVPSYSMHALISKVTRTPWKNGKRREDFSLDAKSAAAEISDSKVGLVFITTPNNPTGSAVSLKEIEELAIVAKGVGSLLIVDEAYAEFAKERSATTLIEKHENLVVVRTMSKAFAFAGARVGYMAAHPAVIDAIQLVRLPYHLSALTQAAALVALDHEGELLKGVAKIVNARNDMSIALEKLGCKVVPSEANFLLFTVSSPDEVWRSLVERGVLIRDVGLSGYLRVTIGTDIENKSFLEALRAILELREY